MEKNVWYTYPMVEVKRVSANKVILTSFAVDFSDLLLNFTVALLSGSVVMVTQVLEALADLVASGFLYIGIRRAFRKDDKGHPFGYGREIYFWALLSALIMFGVTSTVSTYLGWQRFKSPEQVHDAPLAIVVLLITFFTNGYAFRVSLKRLLRSRDVKHIVKIFFQSSLVETKTTFILDFLGTLASLWGAIALVIYLINGDARYDGLGAMAIGITLGIFSILLLLGIKDLLVGRSASSETEERIKKAALEIPEVESIIEIKTLHVGPERLLVNLDVNMKDDLSTQDLEMLIDKIKGRITREVPSVKYLQVELETPA